MKIGVLGGGQLGRMIGEAAQKLGHRCRFLDPAESPCAAAFGVHHRASFDDREALNAFIDGIDILTYEFENVPVEPLEDLEKSEFKTIPIRPRPKALRVSQDRFAEKEFFARLEIPTVAYRKVDSPEELAAAFQDLGPGSRLKTRRFGYDGKGQRRLDELGDPAAIWESLGRQPAILEEGVDFDREVSVIAVRGTGGEVATWPAVENHHREGILRLSLAPAPGLDPEAARDARVYTKNVLEALDYVGVVAIEYFLAGSRVIANEMAPRVHNSGHWTIEGSTTSQFANHVRVITGNKPAPTDMDGVVAMMNLIGDIPPECHRLAEADDLTLHVYGKEPRPGRKVGHLTLRAPNNDVLRWRLNEVAASLADPHLLDCVSAATL